MKNAPCVNSGLSNVRNICAIADKPTLPHKLMPHVTRRQFVLRRERINLRPSVVKAIGCDYEGVVRSPSLLAFKMTRCRPTVRAADCRSDS